MLENHVDKEQLFLQEVSIEDAYLNKLFGHVDRDFGLLGHPPFFMMRSAFKKGVLHADYLTDGLTVYGYVIYQYVPGIDWMHILYFAILPNDRSKGLGSTLMNRLDTLSNSRILLEVEDPKTAKSHKERDVCLRRISFYERNGLHLNTHVRLKHFTFHMQIMSHLPLPESEQRPLQRFYRSLYNRVYGFSLANLLIRIQ